MLTPRSKLPLIAALGILLAGGVSVAQGQIITGYGSYGPWGGYYDPYFGSPYGYSPYYDPYGPFALPPLVIPAETMYGPGAVRRFMGVDPPLGSVPAMPTSALPVAPAGVDMVVDPAPRRSNAQTRTRAWNLIQIGDDYFAQQRYAEALNRYRDAYQAAADVPDTHFRYAVAATAVGRYDDAVERLKIGLDILPTWPQAGFKLDRLYGDQQIARQAHLEALAHQAAARGGDADLLFLLGVQLYLSDQPERAEPMLRRARQLTAGDAAHIDAFLSQLDEQPRAGIPAADPAAPLGKNPEVDVLEALRHF